MQGFDIVRVVSVGVILVGVAVANCTVPGGQPDAKVPSDTGSDASIDSGADANFDAGSDASSDSGSDASSDSGSDASSDAGLDASIDSGSDASVDAGLDGGPFAVTSSSFANGSTIPLKYAATYADGGNVSPALTLASGLPSGASAWGVYMYDISASDFPHWIVLNIPSPVKTIAESGENAIGANVVMPYTGPYPPQGTGRHTYIIKVYALNRSIPNPSAVQSQSRTQFETTYAGYIVTSTTYTGYYEQ